MVFTIILPILSSEKDSEDIVFGIIVSTCIILAIVLYYVWRDRYKIKKEHINLIKRLQTEQPFSNRRAFRFVLHNESNGDSLIKSIKNSKTKEALEITIYMELQQLMNEDKLYRDSKLTRDKVVAKLGTSRKTFIEVLQNHINMTFIEYVNTFRLNEATTLLENEEYTNETIAEEAGFGSVNTFYRQFRNKYGISPSEYRKALSNSLMFNE